MQTGLLKSKHGPGGVYVYSTCSEQGENIRRSGTTGMFLVTVSRYIASVDRRMSCRNMIVQGYIHELYIRFRFRFHPIPSSARVQA